ncbi:hypothetical protein B0H19DRAFT_1080317 [Mycena capillaripes]|nr:hypothetical protein B0H19DRAFT_1080317 [Mycena capillaripes]
MASFVRYASPIADTEKPPPPVVLLLLHTDLTVTRLMIHEDLEHPVPSARQTVVFAPVEHTYPPPPIFTDKIPAPPMLTRKIIENHDTWDFGERETGIIKTTVHILVDQLLDAAKSLASQDTELIQEVFQRAAQMHPDLRKFEDDWVTLCIIQARLKAISSANKVAKDMQQAKNMLAEIADIGRCTPKPKKQ